MRIRRILVAIEFPAEADQPGLDKAVQLAVRCGAQLSLFHAAWDPGAGRYGAGTEQRDIEYVLSLRAMQLERLAAARRTSRLRITSGVQWSRPPAEAIGREAERLRADLIVGQSHRHGAARWLLTYTDWQLIRHTARPLLLVKSAQAWSTPRILAAIDPTHAHDKPARLDRAILGSAAALARGLGGKLSVLHAFAPAVRFIPGTALEPIPVLAPPKEQRIHTRAVRERVLRVTRSAKIPAARVRIESGDVAKVLPAYAAEIGAAVTVLGAVSRGTLQRWFLGSTAETVLDRLNCDVLVVPLVPRRRT